MAEVKNTFLKSRMNQDLDDRLLPSGEYREASNINVSRSEGNDVGALENTLGNQLSTDFSSLGANLKAVGQFTDHNNNYIYLFLTNETDINPISFNYNENALNFIVRVDPQITSTTVFNVLAQGAWLNFSTTNLILGVNLIEDLLFWTDNRNQPRKINVVTAVANASYYTTEDQISVAKYNPWEVIDLYDETVNPGVYETTMKDVVNEFLPDNTTSNPYYDNNYPGDADFLEDKFVRFSYRFKFDDGEYSIIAPFTQEAYIPKQDGYFITTEAGVPNGTDENAAYRSTIVKFMENKVNNIVLNIPLPTTGDNLFADYKITELDIIYKESDGLAFRVVDTIEQQEIQLITNDFFAYNYQAKKPIKTLPPGETTRVFDKVPVRALSQEITGNRVIYGNFQDKHTPPANLNYNVGVSEKQNLDIDNNPVLNKTSIIEYPEHTVKQNRNYQVGVVLSDRYGRTSDVLLSIVNEGAFSAVLGDFYASTVYHPYKTTSDEQDWPGDAIKLLFNAVITSTKNPVTGTPGLYNGDPNSSSYNPLGWYSYKIVVKQQEQDYYNVYLPGIINGYPEKHGSAAGFEQDITAFISLHSDNINKVPRDLSEVGPDQKQYRSSVRLFGRVTPAEALADEFNMPYFPLTEFHSVSAIGDQDTLIDITAGDILNDIYTSESDPLLVRIEQTGNAIGRLPAPQQGSYKILLGVYETNPVISAIDIYWETSTTGLISDLNDAILSGTGTVKDINNFVYTHNEGMAVNTVITSDFYPRDFANLPINPSTGVITLVQDLSGNISRASDFILERTAAGDTTPNGFVLAYDSYVLRTNALFYYGSNATLIENYIFTFNFTQTATGDSGDVNETGFLTNVAPTIACPGIISIGPPPHVVPQLITTLTAINGTADTPLNTNELVWSITSQAPSPIFTINSSTGVLTSSDPNAAGNYDITVKVFDALQGTGSLQDTCSFSVSFGKQPVSQSFNNGCGRTASKVLEGTGFVWAGNVTKGLANPPISGPLPLDSGVTVWTSEDLPTSSSGSVTDYNSVGGCFDTNGSPYNVPFRNNWLNSGRDGTGVSNQADANLSEGTAYITLKFKANQFPWNNLSNSSSGVNVPVKRRNWCWAVLQYRDPDDPNYPNNSWVTAIDIEGNECKFGGGQASSLSTVYSPGTGCLTALACNGQPSVNVGGVKLFDGEAPTDGPFAGTVPEDEQFYTEITDPISSSSAPVSTEGRKTFVFGKDQRDNGGSNPNTFFGDYRLMVSMPGGDINGSGSTVYNRINQQTQCVFPAQVDGYFQGSEANALSQSDSFNGVEVNWGDFYYPSCDYTDVAYQYNLNLVSYDNPFDANIGQSSGGIVLYAREWNPKYLTQLYTDIALTNKWTPPSAAYSPQWFKIGSQANIDLENAHVDSSGSQVNGESENSRYWVIGVDTTGLKVPGESDPSQF